MDIHPKQRQIGYLMIYDVIQSLFVLIEKLAFFNKQLWGFIISLILLIQEWLALIRFMFLANAV